MFIYFYLKIASKEKKNMYSFFDIKVKTLFQNDKNNELTIE
jgi:hypothetical protein